MRAEGVQRGTGRRVQDDVLVRRVTPDDWPAVRALRLEMLEDRPVAYCERLSDAVRAPDDDWRARAAQGAEGGESFQVIAWSDGGPVATARGFLEDGDAVLAAVYVASGHRGTGLVGRLVEQVSGWAQARSAARLRLVVHETNDRARAAYEKLGFAVTGHREPYPLDPSTQQLEMARDLPGRAQNGGGSSGDPGAGPVSTPD